MRRGFYGWDENELPLAMLDERAGRVQDGMRAEKLDALLLYTNIARPAAVTWLTGFTPYWSEGLLLVPKSGAPDFATALSNRVGEWMRSVTPTGSILCTPQPAKFFGERLAKENAKRIGVLELDMLPGGQAQTLAAAAPSLELVDASAFFRRARVMRDESEAKLFAAAARIAEKSFAAITPASIAKPFEAMGAVEKSARDQRAEEIFVTIAPDLKKAADFVRVDRAPAIGETFAIRASVAYKSTWVRRTRSFSTDAALTQKFAALDAAFAQCLASFDAGAPVAKQIAAAFPGAKLVHWSLEACVGSYPLEFIAGDEEAGDARDAKGAGVLAVELNVDGARWLAQGPIGQA